MNKVFIGKYKKEQAFKNIEDYNQLMSDYYKERGCEHAATAVYYKKIEEKYNK